MLSSTRTGSRLASLKGSPTIGAPLPGVAAFVLAAFVLAVLALAVLALTGTTAHGQGAEAGTPSQSPANETGNTNAGSTKAPATAIPSEQHDTDMGALEGLPEAYVTLIQQAVSEFELAHWGEAVTLFRKANEVYPNARALRGLGLSAFENRSYVQATRALQQALAEQRRPLTEEQRKSVNDVLTRALAFTVRVHVAVEPADANVTVNGAPLAPDAEGRILLDPGEHEFVASADGYLPARRKLTARSGRDVRIELQLQPQPTVAKGPGPVRAPPPIIDEGIPTLTYVGIGVAGAGLIMGAIFGALAADKESELDQSCPRGRCTDPSLMSTRDDGRTFATVADVGFIATAAGAASAVIALIATGPSERMEGPSSPQGTTDTSGLRAKIGLGSIVLTGSL